MAIQPISAFAVLFQSKLHEPQNRDLKLQTVRPNRGAWWRLG